LVQNTDKSKFVESGRPNLDAIVLTGKFDLISVCGPDQMIESAREVTRNRGIAYKEEIF